MYRVNLLVNIQEYLSNWFGICKNNSMDRIRVYFFLLDQCKNEFSFPWFQNSS